MDYRRWPLLAAWLCAAGGCSLLDPKVGPAQAACDDQQGGSNGSGYGPSTPDASGTCGSDAGSDCDDCESQHCCQTRLSCYGDPVCNCADQALDMCLQMASNDDAGTTTDGSDPVARCWDAFSATGRIAQARLACERAWCQVACAIP